MVTRYTFLSHKIVHHSIRGGIGNQKKMHRNQVILPQLSGQQKILGLMLVIQDNTPNIFPRL